MPVSAGGIPITMWTVGFASLSLVVLVATVFLARGESLFGSQHGRGVNLVTLAMGTFTSAFLLCLGLNIDKAGISFPYTLLLSVLQAIKTTGGGNTPLSLSAVKLSRILGGEAGHTNAISENLCHAVYFYQCVLYIVAPVSFVSVLVSRLMNFFALPRAHWRALHRDTYVFDELSEPTLTLARSIEKHAKTTKDVVNLVFTDTNNNVGDAFHARALALGATCVQNSVETVWKHLPHGRHVHIILTSKDEKRNITRASSISRACASAAKNWKPPLRYRLPVKHKALEAWTSAPHVTISAVTTLRGAESLFEHEELDVLEIGEEQFMRVPVRCIDWTRNTTEKILGEYPLFLLGRQPELPQPSDGVAYKSYLAWQNAMLDEDRRHVVVVGAGHVGMEFLSLALSTSRNGSPSDKGPLQYRFDVFDNKADALHKSECLAKYRFIAQTDGNANELDKLACEFHLYDVLGNDFLDKLVELNNVHGGITYLVVALGDDFATAQVSLRIRELFSGRDDGRLASAGGVGAEGQPQRECARQEHIAREALHTYARTDADVKRVQPVIVAALDDAELCNALAQAKRGGFDYAIDTMGSPQDMYTYELVFGENGVPEQVTERERKAVRAKKLHEKYKLFSYMRSQQGSANGVCGYAINWRTACGREQQPDDEAGISEVRAQFRQYQQTQQGRWLDHMEQERLRTYSWAEGGNQ